VGFGMDKLRVGIVGSKFAATLHAECYRRNEKVQMVAVASLDEVERFAATFGIPHAYGDYHEMVSRNDLDAVSVCVPNFLHRDVAVAAARAKKHVICEKALAATVAEAAEMVDVCAAEGVKLFYAEDWIFAPSLTRMERIIAEGALGEILFVKARETHSGTHSPFAKRKSTCGGGALVHLAVHPIGYVLHLFGVRENPVREVTGMVSGGWEHNLVHKDMEVEDWSAGLLQFADGKRALVEGNYITVGGMDDRVDVYGTEGRIAVDLTLGSNLEVYSRRGYGYAVEKADFTHGWTRPAVDEFHSLGYVSEINYFVDCILRDEDPKFGVSGAGGVACMRVVEALYRSAGERRTIEVEC
jgi:predicted dehydrogenase